MKGGESGCTEKELERADYVNPENRKMTMLNDLKLTAKQLSIITGESKSILQVS